LCFLIDLTILPFEIWHILSVIILKTIQNSCERGDIYDLFHSYDYVMQTKLFLNSYEYTFLILLRELNKVLSNTSTSHARIFSYLLIRMQLPFSLNSFLVKMILQGWIWIVIQIIHFLIDVLSSVDRFNLSSLNLSLFFRSTSNDSCDFGIAPLMAATHWVLNDHDTIEMYGQY